MFKRRLNDEEMERLEVKAREGDGTNTIIAFYDVALGDAGSSWDEEDSIDPRRFSIPTDQWGAIVNAFPKLQRESFGLTWMNIGPSGYKEGK